MCLVFKSGVRISLHGFVSKGRIHIAYERMASRGNHHDGCEMQIQDDNLEEIICLNLPIHLAIMDMIRCA